MTPAQAALEAALTEWEARNKPLIDATLSAERITAEDLATRVNTEEAE